MRSPSGSTFFVSRHGLSHGLVLVLLVGFQVTSPSAVLGQALSGNVSIALGDILDNGACLAPISGTVADGMATPIEGAWVEVFRGVPPYEPVSASPTAADGTYSSEPLGDGIYRLAVTDAPAWVREVWPDSPFVGEPDPATGWPIGHSGDIGTSAVDFLLDPAGALSGRLTTDGTTSVLAGRTVDLFDFAGSPLATTATDDDADYLFVSLPPGIYLVATDAGEAWTDEVYDDVTCEGCDVTDGDPVRVLAGVKTQDISFDLDLHPSVVFLDGFESGDTTAWSADR